MNHDRNSDLEVLEAMGQRFFPVPELAAVQAAISEIYRGVAVRKEGSSRWGEDNRAKCRAVMVTGLTRHGKTELVEQVANGLHDAQAADGTTIAHQPAFVETPSVFTNALLFNLTLKAMMGDDGNKRLLPTAMAYDRVDRQLPVHQPTLLVLDEFQYAFKPSGVGMRRRNEVVLETLGYVRHLLDHAAWPVPIVLVGLPDLAELMNAPAHAFLNEKITPIYVTPMVQGSATEIRTLREALKAYCDDAGIESTIAGDEFFQRVIHACDRARGLAFELFQACVMAAWRNGRRPLQEKDFVDRYRIATNVIDDQNPFHVAGWENTDRERLMQDTAEVDLATWKVQTMEKAKTR